MTQFRAPVRGWIRAIRDGLGMTTAQLARRLGVKQPSVTALEQSEARGSIELATLRRVAEALDCTLVYALVPNKPLETMVRDRASAVLRQRREPVEHTMLLENQAVDPADEPADEEEQLNDFLSEVKLSRIWDDR